MHLTSEGITHLLILPMWDDVPTLIKCANNKSILKYKKKKKKKVNMITNVTFNGRINSYVGKYEVTTIEQNKEGKKKKNSSPYLRMQCEYWWVEIQIKKDPIMISIPTASLASFSQREEMVDRTKSKVLIREYNEDKDAKMVRKLERNCEGGTKKVVSIFTNMTGDPLSRIRFFPLHVMLVGDYNIPFFSLYNVVFQIFHN